MINLITDKTICQGTWSNEVAKFDVQYKRSVIHINGKQTLQGDFDSTDF